MYVVSRHVSVPLQGSPLAPVQVEPAAVERSWTAVMKSLQHVLGTEHPGTCRNGLLEGVPGTGPLHPSPLPCDCSLGLTQEFKIVLFIVVLDSVALESRSCELNDQLLFVFIVSFEGVPLSSSQGVQGP